MQSTPELIQNEAGYWIARWYIRRPGETKMRRRTHSFQTRDAEQAKIRMGAWLDAGGHRSKREIEPGATVEQVCARYLTMKAEPDGNRRTQELALAAPRRALGSRTAASITGDDARDYAAHRAKGRYGPPGRPVKPISPSTVRRELNALQAALNWVSPDRKVHLPKPSDAETEKPWLREEQARLLLAKLEDQDVRVRFFAKCGMLYGARRGAIMGLEWEWGVDRENGLLRFQNPAARRTRKRKPLVAIDPRIEADLDQLHEMTGGVGRVLTGRVPEMFTAFANSLGFGARVTPHILKHTMATLSMRARLSPFDIAEICATDERTLRRVYGHHDPKRAAKNVGAFL